MIATVVPITNSDMVAAADFLSQHLNTRVSPAQWRQAVDVPWDVDAPNHGFMLCSHGRIVGIYLAYYSSRCIRGDVEKFCNLGAWCVLPDYRAQSFRLLKALLAQPGYHFTDLSPSGNVVPLNLRLKFQLLDTRTVLMPNLPWPRALHRGIRLIQEPDRVRAVLRGKDFELYRDHATAPAAQHIVLARGSEVCYVMFRKDRRKGVPGFASILHVGNPALFEASSRVLARHLLLREHVLATLAELRTVGSAPRPSIHLRSARPKMFRSATLTSVDIDNLYSELTCLRW